MTYRGISVRVRIGIPFSFSVRFVISSGMQDKTTPVVAERIVVCRRTGAMSGGVAILIGLVFVGLHFTEGETDRLAVHPDIHHATLILGVMLLGFGVAIAGFSRIVRVGSCGGRIVLSRGWMIFNRLPVLLPGDFSSVSSASHVPRFGGYLGATSTIVWTVALHNEKSARGADVAAFSVRDQAEALVAEIQSAAAALTPTR